MSHPLSSNEIELALDDLKGWTYEDRALVKTFSFKTFREAFSFLTRIAFEAEEMNHHPEIHNVYNKVLLTLRTHDAGGQVTQKDVKLAEKVEAFSWVE